jgi:SAM-dependent methyltransferase
MHESSYNEMKNFIERYLDKSRELSILDIGSLDVFGTYKPLFDNPKWKYTGLDLIAGKNVDIVSPEPYHYPLNDGAFDVVISGSCIEHVEDLHAFIKEAARVMKRNGIMCMIAPWIWEEHRYPQDCWRILPDGMRFLLEKIAGVKVLRIGKNKTDCIGIAGVNQIPVKISFGVLVNDPLKLDAILRKSGINGDMHFIKEPESATKGLNKLLDIMESEGADIAVLTHQDMYYRQGWVDRVTDQLKLLPKSWVVAGPIGKDMKGDICGVIRNMQVPTPYATDHQFPVSL